MCFLVRQDGHPPAKFKAPWLIYLTEKLREAVLLLALEKKLRCKTTLLQSLSTLSSLRMDPGGHPLMFMSVLCTYLACFTYKGQMT